MPYAFHKVRVNDDGEDGDALNGFLATHRILGVRNEWMSDGENSFWAFCIDYFDGSSASGVRSKSGSRRVDYKEVLSPEDFAVFAKLRDWRKAVAEKDGVPVFTIFTNEQLAQIVQKKVASLADLREIDGIGEARAEKYGESVLNVLKELAL